MSEIATIGLLQRDGIRAHEFRATQLQTALDSRILIEQANGILSERLGLSLDDAFGLLREHSRNRRLREIAQGIVDATEELSPLTTEQPTSSRAAGEAGSAKRPSAPPPLAMPRRAGRLTSDTTCPGRAD